MNSDKILFFLLFIFLFSCSSNENSPFSFIDKNVYIGGRFGYQASYWNNGARKSMTDPASNCSAIFVSGSDVYLAGDAPNSNDEIVSTYWKNGNPSYSPVLGYATGIAVSNSDVYTTVNDGGVASYYLNGIESYLPGSTYSTAKAIIISGSDVFIAGMINNNSTAIYWKNGIAISLGGTNGVGTSSSAVGIEISGQDVYMAGAINGVATYWKNGVPQQLENAVNATNPSANATLSSIAVSSFGDVYVAGAIFTSINGIFYSSAAYWKNGALVPLEQSSATQSSSATAIAVSGSDVHIVGDIQVFGQLPLPTYWKNGVRHNLGQGELNSIFIVQ